MTTQPKYIASFGRRKGHKLRPSRIALFNKLLPALLIPQGDEPLSASGLFGNNNPIWLELGFGGGEHLAEQARRHPMISFIGCEPYINGMSTLLASIDENKLGNIRLYDGDARDILERMPDESIDRLFILFPDPWPKTRHHKRRIINQKMLSLVYQKLKTGAALRVATDHVDYQTWIIEQFLIFNKFHWTAKRPQDWQTPPQDWVPTRYQGKAEAEGRMPIFLDFIK